MNNNVVSSSLALLGLRGKDKVTDFEGVVSSVCFDAYGCVQVLLTPPCKDGSKIGESFWFDVKRLDVTAKRVLPAPNFLDMLAGQEPGGNKLPQPASAPAPY